MRTSSRLARLDDARPRGRRRSSAPARRRRCFESCTVCERPSTIERAWRECGETNVTTYPSVPGDQDGPAGREVVRGRAGRAWRRSPRRSRARPATGRRRPTRRSPCGPGVALVSTMSLTPVIALAARTRRRASAGRAPRTRRRTRARARPRGRVPAMLVRKPTRPKFTPRHGMPVPSQRWSARSIVPSPPSTTTMSRMRRSSTTSTPQRAATARSRSRRVADDLGAAVGQEGRARHRHAVTTRRAHVRSGSATSAVWSSCAGCACDARYTTYSRFPAGPGTQESHTPRTAQPLAGRKRGEILQHPPAHLPVADDAPTDLGPAGLELGLHEHERPPRIGGARQHGREHEPERDERDVGRHEARVGTAAPRSRASGRSSRRSR